MSSKSQQPAPRINIYWDRRILAITALGVISGLPWSLTHTTLGYWLTTEGISMKTVGLFALTSLPYAFKFLWAPLFDLYHAPLVGRDRSGWMIISQVGLLGSLIAMSLLNPKIDVELIALLALFTSFFSASQDIAVDGWRVDALTDDEQGVGASVATLGYRIGMYISSAGALLMSAYLPWRWVYTVLAIIVCLGTIVSWWTASKRMKEVLAKSERVRPLAPPRWLTILTVCITIVPFLLVMIKGGLHETLTIERSWMISVTKSLKWGAGLLIIGIVCALVFTGVKKRKSQSFMYEAKERWGDRWLYILAFVCVFRLGDHLLGLFLFPSF